MHDSSRSVESRGASEHPEIIRSLEDSFTDLAARDISFEAAARSVAQYQRDNVPLYSRYWDALGGEAIPFLPIRAFKDAPIIAGSPADAEAVFLSSGTTSAGRSRHFVRQLSVYRKSYETRFKETFGCGPFTFLAHLPGYAEAGSSSSLVYMAEGLIERFGDNASGLFLDDTTLLADGIRHCQERNTTMILLGAAFGLLDLADTQRWSLPRDAVIIETGGMKTHRQSIERDTLYDRLAAGFDVDTDQIYSEYGMCEMLSQCYSKGMGPFHPPTWLRFEIRSLDNPLELAPHGSAGLLAVLDLANMHSVSAILTEDLATAGSSGFHVIGRVQGADLRGCNMLIESLAS